MYLPRRLVLLKLLSWNLSKKEVEESANVVAIWTKEINERTSLLERFGTILEQRQVGILGFWTIFFFSCLVFFGLFLVFFFLLIFGVVKLVFTSNFRFFELLLEQRLLGFTYLSDSIAAV